MKGLSYSQAVAASANLQGGVDRSRFYAASAISVLMKAELSLTMRTPIFQEGTTGASLD